MVNKQMDKIKKCWFCGMLNYGEHAPKCPNRPKEEILEEFAKKLIKDSVDIPPDFAQVINDNFWELL